MPFLTLNGWTVPVATCTADHNLTGGGERRAFDGTFHRHSLGGKRTWQVKTQLLPYTDLDTLRAIVGWQGIYIPLDTSLASSSGLLPRPTAHATLVPTVAAD